jgi:hypothetical protein
MKAKEQNRTEKKRKKEKEKKRKEKKQKSVRRKKEGRKEEGRIGQSVDLRCFVEDGLRCRREWQMYHIIISSCCLLNPLSIRCLLNSVCWPIFRICGTFTNVKLPFYPKRHCCVTRVRTHSESKSGIETVETNHCQEVTCRHMKKKRMMRIARRMKAKVNVKEEEEKEEEEEEKENQKQKQNQNQNQKKSIT